jgi:hypothetical protein
MIVFINAVLPVAIPGNYKMKILYGGSGEKPLRLSRLIDNIFPEIHRRNNSQK